MLVGRDRERSQFDALLSRVRAGGSAALVITGEADIGKTSLLEYVISQADGLRARGAEREQSLPFAGLADLVRPISGHLDMLPSRAAYGAGGRLGGTRQPFRGLRGDFWPDHDRGGGGPVLAIRR